MTINKDSWHCRVYQWWYGHRYGGERTFTNLCPYMRTVLFYAPLRFLFSTWVKLGRVPLCVLTLPAVLLPLPFLAGYKSYTLKVILFVLLYMIPTGVAILGSAVLAGMWAVKQSSFRYFRVLVSTKFEEKIEPRADRFRDLFRAYIRSGHDRICPEISW